MGVSVILALAVMQAVASTAPVPVRPLLPLISPDDYPASALRSDEQGTVRVSLTVDQTGRVVACVVAALSGSSALDAATCRLMRIRARFHPATDNNGQPTIGSYAFEKTWRYVDGVDTRMGV